MKNKKFSHVVALIRSYNNPDIVKQVRRLKDLGIGAIFIVTKADQDRNSTPVWLERGSLYRDVKIVQMWESYHWSTSLNMGICSIQIENLRRKTNDEELLRYVLDCSVEALFEETHLELMLNRFDDEQVAVVGTSFAAQSMGVAVSTGRSYMHPRNTGMFIDLAKFPMGVPLFDSFCDQVGGMEDIDFVFRIHAFSSYQVVMVDGKVPLVVNKHYDQLDKEEREQRAMDHIIARWRKNCTIGTQESDRIEMVIKQMQLEDPKTK